MKERIMRMLEATRRGDHYKYRRKVDFVPVEKLLHLTITNRVAERLKQVLEAEEPVILPDETIVYTRTVENLPPVYTKMEWKKIKETHFIHEQGRVCNISPDYERVIRNGLDKEREKVVNMLSGADEKEEEFLRCIIKSIDAVLDLAERYREAADKAGNTIAAEVLSRIPHQGARTFQEALQFFRILHFTLWCEGEYHNTVGRFDQYMAPYFQEDIRRGRLNRESALELIEEFFLSFNRDSDLYPGIQQGDNGQSMVLGGTDEAGQEVYSLLSELCLEASRELQLIDPKINLRVSHQTPLNVYEKATELTKAGLGFPQYSNDDIVIEGLIRKGYAPKDACDYVVAACWEFIIPKVGMDIPNIGAVNFPKIINDTVLEILEESSDFESFYDGFRERLKAECHKINDSIQNLYIIPAPFMSLMMKGCIEKRRDISLGNRYNNYGFHGVGISTAIDSLAAVKKYIFDEERISKRQAVDVVRGNNDAEDLLIFLRYQSPKFGDNNRITNELAQRVFEDFGKVVDGLTNDRGGCVRAGTGAAMYYLWYADQTGNTLSGRRKGEPFSANYAPELFVQNRGPLSVITSFTKPELTNTINGGPLTMEFHSTVFKEDDGIRKVAWLVYQFVKHGGHQLQLNAVDKEKLIEAQKEPEKYRNLIVRIWGWSAYFVELDREYQDHVIARQNFSV